MSGWRIFDIKVRIKSTNTGYREGRSELMLNTKFRHFSVPDYRLRPSFVLNHPP